ncbi:hypothetical protein MKW92_026418, partial [Papaver armeniacum]
MFISLNLERISAYKSLLGFLFDSDGMGHLPKIKVEDAFELIALLDSNVNEAGHLKYENYSIS